MKPSRPSLIPPGPAPTLDDEQLALWQSAPDAVEAAVDLVLAELGPTYPADALHPLARHATYEAAKTFDPARGISYREWAVFYAAHRLCDALDAASRDDPHHGPAIRRAVLRFTLHHAHAFDAREDTHESVPGTLGGFSDGLLFAMAMEIGAPAIGSRGEPDVTDAEDARLAADAVRKVVAELRPDQRWLLTRTAAYEQPVKDLARESPLGYRTLLKDYEKTVALAGARLRALGVRGSRPWIRGAAGSVLDDPPANEGGRRRPRRRR